MTSDCGGGCGCGRKPVVVELEGVLATKDQQIRQLRAALARWGQHDPHCASNPCACGLSKALTVGAKGAVTLVMHSEPGTGRTWGGETDAAADQPERVR